MAQVAVPEAGKNSPARKIGRVQQFFSDDKRFLLVILLPVVLFFLIWNALPTMGARIIGPETAKLILDEWLPLRFQDGSSTPKVEEINELEKENFKE